MTITSSARECFMECRVEESDGVAVLSPRGDLDAGTVGSFQAKVDELLAMDTHYFVVDLGDVGFMDSAGLSALVRLYKRVRIGEGNVGLADVQPEVMKVLELTRLSRVFDIFATASEAAASIKQNG